MSELAVMDDGAMVVDERGIIVWVGCRADAPQANELLDCEGRLITPGLVDAHSHLVFAGNRANEFESRTRGATYQEIAAEGGGIQSTVKATRAATLEQLTDAGRDHARWAISMGTTTIEVKTGYGLDLENETKMYWAIMKLAQTTSLNYVPTLLVAHAYPPEFHSDRASYVDLICETILPQMSELQIAYVDAFCEDKYFDVATTERILGCAKQLGFSIRLHADQLTNCGGAILSAKLGAKTADHLEQTDEAGISAMKEAGVQPVLLPASVYALGLKKYPEARKMIEAGLAVVLATDFNPGSSPTPSLPFVMSLACTQMGMTPSEALTACTINAAHSLDRGSRCGSLEVGKRGDFVVWDCSDPREIPYWIGAPLVNKVFIEGRDAFTSVGPRF